MIANSSTLSSRINQQAQTRPRHVLVEAHIIPSPPPAAVHTRREVSRENNQYFATSAIVRPTSTHVDRTRYIPAPAFTSSSPNNTSYSTPPQSLFRRLMIEENEAVQQEQEEEDQEGERGGIEMSRRMNVATLAVADGWSRLLALLESVTRIEEENRQQLSMLRQQISNDDVLDLQMQHHREFNSFLDNDDVTYEGFGEAEGINGGRGGFGGEGLGMTAFAFPPLTTASHSIREREGRRQMYNLGNLFGNDETGTVRTTTPSRGIAMSRGLGLSENIQVAFGDDFMFMNQVGSDNEGESSSSDNSSDDGEDSEGDERNFNGNGLAQFNRTMQGLRVIYQNRRNHVYSNGNHFGSGNDGGEDDSEHENEEQRRLGTPLFFENGRPSILENCLEEGGGEVGSAVGFGCLDGGIELLWRGLDGDGNVRRAESGNEHVEIVSVRNCHCYSSRRRHDSRETGRRRLECHVSFQSVGSGGGVGR
ncbi:hypothetical protein HK100_007963 [Physocladia obscura]|uniref:Uncharacterized protein n=1 Tax=Physocladia obscura TaxID=109957 RepID=A0AAD5T5E6_9FUNG|nr:hypothetical protein HK100_007963 [Physocladia obscura]